MSEKEEIKVRLSTVIYIIIIFILIIALGVVYYLGFISNKNENDNSDNQNIVNINHTEDMETNVEAENKIERNSTSNNEKIEEKTETVTTKETLELGTYNINGEPIDPSDGSGISSVTLSKNNKFTIELVYSEEYTGTYEIKDNKLICNSTKHELYAGGTATKNTKAIFEFEIINSNKIKFSNIKNSSDKFELNKGISYTKK